MSQAAAPEPARANGADRAGLVIALALMAAGLLVAWSTSRAGGTAGYSPVGPKTVPFIVAGVLVLLSVLTAAAAVRRDFPARERVEAAPMLWIVGGLVLQMLTMRTVGFSLATGLLFAFTARGFGRGPLWLTIPIGIVFSFVVWFVFSKGLQLSLPAGPFERLF